jgi:general nucleoside transport system permease protein
LNLNDILTAGFLVALLTAGIRLAMPILLAVLGEIITEKSGVLNLGLEGILLMGALAGFMVAWWCEQAGVDPTTAAWLGLGAGVLAGMLMGLIMALLAVTLRADQVISSVMLVLLGQGLSSYLYRQQFSSLTARIGGLPPVPIPGLAEVPILGPIFFNHDMAVYLAILLVPATWFLLYQTTLGLNIRAVGEKPSAVEASGLSVARIRYTATLLGAGLTGLGGAILTVAQLHLFREEITAGRGWIAVALVIFARWRPGLALVGALLFGVADALQFRIQALSGSDTAIPYEILLMLPYLLTIGVLFRGIKIQERPESLGAPYVRGER